MKFYDITYIVEDEQQERLLALAERYEKVNGWNEKEILQFAVTATSKNDIESKLHFLENEIIKYLTQTVLNFSSIYGTNGLRRSCYHLPMAHQWQNRKEQRQMRIKTVAEKFIGTLKK